MNRVGQLETRTPKGAALNVFFDVGVEADVAVAVAIEDVLIGGFDTTGEAPDPRLKTIPDGSLPTLARHAADLSDAPRVTQGRGTQSTSRPVSAPRSTIVDPDPTPGFTLESLVMARTLMPLVWFHRFPIWSSMAAPSPPCSIYSGATRTTPLLKNVPGTNEPR